MSDRIGNYRGNPIGKNVPVSDQTSSSRERTKRIKFNPSTRQVSLQTAKVERREIGMRLRVHAEKLIQSIVGKDPKEFLVRLAYLSRFPEALRETAIHEQLIGWEKWTADNTAYLFLLADHTSKLDADGRSCWTEFLCPAWINTKLGSEQDFVFPAKWMEGDVERAKEGLEEAFKIVSQTPYVEAASLGPETLNVENHASNLIEQIKARDLQFFITLAYLSRFPRPERINAINEAFAKEGSNPEALATNIHFLGDAAGNAREIVGLGPFQLYTQNLVTVWTSTKLMTLPRDVSVQNEIPQELRQQVAGILQRAISIWSAKV
jgi:hypothetical protein